MLGFDVTNDIFAENAWFFRNSLVRVNYNDLKNGIHETTEYLEAFLRNLLLNENHPLHNLTLHINETLEETEKTDIEATKADIEKRFRPKTASHILKLREAFPDQMSFGRSDMMIINCFKLNFDVKPEEIKEIVYQATAYLGIVRVFPFLTITNEVFQELGIALPLPPQANWRRNKA